MKSRSIPKEYMSLANTAEPPDSTCTQRGGGMKEGEKRGDEGKEG
jgi:hypothetical protein